MTCSESFFQTPTPLNTSARPSALRLLPALAPLTFIPFVRGMVMMIVLLGAIGVFGEKYSDMVSIYTIYDPASGEIISREFCGGPHVEHTGIIGHFKIAKEEASSAGVRRIKAIIE